jgi:hypothetical protein
LIDDARRVSVGWEWSALEGNLAMAPTTSTPAPTPTPTPVPTPTPASSSLLSARIIDSALVIATIVAAVNFAGWSYRQAYFGRFSVDPSSLGGSNVAIAVEGFGAIFSTTGEWFKAIFPLLVAALIMMLLARLIDRARAASHATPFFDPLAVFMARVGVSSIAILLVMLGGQVAGTSRAKDRITNIQQGKVWAYHLDREVVPGVMLAQANDLTWLLTCAGVRPIKTSDIRLIDGPLFNFVKGSAEPTRPVGCPLATSTAEAPPGVTSKPAPTPTARATPPAPSPTRSSTRHGEAAAATANASALRQIKSPCDCRRDR